MKNIKKVIFNTSLIVLSQALYCTNISADIWPSGKELGSELAKTMAPSIEKASKEFALDAAKILAPGMLGVTKAVEKLGVKQLEMVAEILKDNQGTLIQVTKTLETASINLGKNAGLATTNAIGNGITAAFSAAQSAAVATGASIKSAAVATAATAKSTAIAVAAAPATPYIVVGAGVIVVSYGGYKVYRHYHPTQEQIAAALKVQVEIAQSHADIAKANFTAAEFKTKLATQQREAEFKAALARNLTAKRNANGIPFACQKEAAYLAMAAGSKKVEKIVADFNKHAFVPQAA
jgi:hypothetical protein